MRTATQALALSLLLPAAALANGYDVPNVNPRDLALAASATAAQVDAESAYANPAALSKLSGLHLSLAASLLDNRTEWNGPSSGDLAGKSSHTQFKPAYPVSLFAAYGFPVGGHAAGVGLGMNVPAGGNVYYPDDWAGRGRIITVDRKIYGFYLTGGLELLEGLRIGGGAVYYYGTEYLKQGIQPFPDAYGELSTKGGAFSYDLAAEYKLAPIPLTLAADYKYKGTMKLSGNGHFVVPEGLLPGSATPPVDQGVKHDLTYPAVLNVGAAYRVTPPVLITAGFTYNWYSVYKSDVFQGDKGTSITVQRNYKNGRTFRLGGEWDAARALQLRAGVLRDLSGLDTDTYSATLPDGNAWAAALGLGYSLQRDLAIQAAFFYAWLDKVTVTGDQELPGSYRTNVWIASLGLTWRTDLGGGR
ncbi:MAG TPA: outer membrane protein transport protein [Anaeromyxobacter sp.]|nr:outer membrane protein transport protein [Anaeromyxobacter sp.]